MKPIAVATLAAMLSLTAGQALADVIDGDWCAPDGRHLSIRGPSVITPGGSEIGGNYARHSFSYVVPAQEPQAGSTVHVRLLNEETVRLWVDQASDAAETWKRCTPISAIMAADNPPA